MSLKLKSAEAKIRNSCSKCICTEVDVKCFENKSADLLDFYLCSVVCRAEFRKKSLRVSLRGHSATICRIFQPTFGCPIVRVSNWQSMIWMHHMQATPNLAPQRQET